MFSSQAGSSSEDAQEDGVLTDLPSDHPPEQQKSPKRKNRPSNSKSPVKLGHRPRVLSFAERVEAWHQYTLGAGIPELAVSFETTITEVQVGLELAAQDLGYPHNHIDPELERFKIVTASDQMKSAQGRLLQDSNKTLNSIREQRSALKAQREEIHIGRETPPEEMKLYRALMDAEAALELRHQLEVKSIISIMAEFRATNLVIADLTGIKRTKPVRKPKQVASPEELLEGLSDAQLIELVESE